MKHIFGKQVVATLTFLTLLIGILNISVHADPGDGDTDNDGVIDAIDIDDDNDGITDALESSIIPTAGTAFMKNPFDTSAPGWYQVVNTYTWGQMYAFDTLLGTYTLLGNARDKGYPKVNGIGLNPFDGFIYGIVVNSSGVDRYGTAITTGDLIKYDRDGELFYVGTPSGNGWVANTGHYSADIYYNTNNLSDPKNGTLWVRNGGANDVAVLDLSDATVLDTFTLTGTSVGVAADIINIDGTFYAIDNIHDTVTGEATLASWDATGYTLGSITSIPATDTTISGFAAGDTGTLGAGYGTKDPDTGGVIPYFSFNTTGSIYELDIPGGTVSYTTQGTETGSNDGAGSVLAPPPVGDFLVDSDGDGIHDLRDLDSDNDGIADLYEAGNTLLHSLDTNKNGTIDSNDATGFLDDGSLYNSVAGNGLDDRIENEVDEKNEGIDPLNSSNSLGENTPDYLDLDSDDDGIPDAIEGRPTTGYTPYNGTGDSADSDDDGILDIFEGSSSPIFGTDGLTTFVEPNDDDSNGIPDYLDHDSDGDGISDDEEVGSGVTLVSTYADPDGSITDTTSILTTLLNEDTDATDVDFRSELVVDEYSWQSEFWCRAVGENVTDPDAINNTAVKATAGVDPGGTLIFGIMPADFIPGVYYAATFRLKVSDITDTNRNIILDVYDPIAEERKGLKLISASDFGTADEYVDFKIPFLQETTQRYEYRVFYSDGVSYDLYADEVRTGGASDDLIESYDATDFDTAIGTLVSDTSLDGETRMTYFVSSANQTGGTLQFGTGKARLKTGKQYRVHFDLKVSNNSSTDEKILIDVYNPNTGHRVYKKIRPSDFISANQYQTFELVFERESAGYEYRVFYYPNSNFDLHANVTDIIKLRNKIKYYSQAENMDYLLGDLVVDNDAVLGTARRITTAQTAGGTFQFGPYEDDLTVGESYTAKFTLKVSDNSSTDEKIFIDVFNHTTGHREYRFLSPSDFKNSNEYQNFQIPFTKVSDGYEYRVFYGENATFDLYSDIVQVID